MNCTLNLRCKWEFIGTVTSESVSSSPERRNPANKGSGDQEEDAQNNQFELDLNLPLLAVALHKK